jgi:DNA-binding GntR family transcriptional regulator
VSVSAPRTAHSYVYEWLRSQIFAGELAPGTPLVQATVAKQLGVSMTPVREALRDLATEGLVTMATHRGATVTRLDLSDAQEIHRIRLKLEPDVVREAVANITDEVLDQAEGLYLSLSNATPSEWGVLNRAFHALLLSTGSNPRTRAILASLLEAAALYSGIAQTRRRGPAPQLEHRIILDAYQARDPEAAAEAMRVHICSSLDSLGWTNDVRD